MNTSCAARNAPAAQDAAAQAPNWSGPTWQPPAPDDVRRRPERAATGRHGAALRSAVTPQDAFDILHRHCAPALVHQVYLLTGRRDLAFESVEHAFHQAWQRWPEVAVDPDPVGWVRQQAYDHALAPWQRFRRPRGHGRPAPAGPAGTALLLLPPHHRRTVLLCDGLGLTVSRTAAETLASTAATRSRLGHARALIGANVPALGDLDAQRAALGRLVRDVSTATVPTARSVRRGSERRTRLLTRTVFGTVAAFIAVIVLRIAS